jgi:transcriptional regulator with XRE-family HTH domain
MDGKKVKDYLDKKDISQQSLADEMDISKQTLSNWLGKAVLTDVQREKIIKALKLPENFFEAAVQEPAAIYGSKDLLDCLKVKAVLEERVAQLETRILEKDATIKILTKQLNK